MSLVQVRAAGVCAGGPETGARAPLCRAWGRLGFFETRERPLQCKAGDHYAETFAALSGLIEARRGA